MIEEQQAIVRDALELIRAAGGAGALKSKVFAAVRDIGGAPLSPEQQDFVWTMLERRGWIDSHIEPVWHNRRWTITERGATALEGM